MPVSDIDTKFIPGDPVFVFDATGALNGTGTVTAVQISPDATLNPPVPAVDVIYTISLQDPVTNVYLQRAEGVTFASAVEARGYCAPC